MSADQSIVVVYGESLMEVELGVEFGFIGGKVEGVGVMRRKRVRGSGSGVFWVSSHL